MILSIKKYIVHILMVLMMLPANLYAGYTITQGTALNFCSGSWPSVSQTATDIKLTETTTNGFKKNQTNTVLVLQLPANFEFEGTLPTVTYTAGADISSLSRAFNGVDKLEITMTIPNAGGDNAIDEIVISNLKIVATASGGSGFMYRNGGTFKVDNLTTNPLTTESWINLTSNTPQTYNSSTTTQTDLSDVAPNSTNNSIIGIEVNTTGDCNTLGVTEFVIGGGSTDDVTDISRVSIYYTAGSNTFAPTTLVATTTTISFPITFNGFTQSLDVSGNNYFWVSFDVPTGAGVGNNLDATCTNVKVDGTDRTPSTQDPGVGRDIGSFFSKVDGNFNVTTSWSVLACGGADAPTTPGVSDNINVCTGNTITLVANTTLKNAVVEGNLDLAGFNLTIKGALTVNGTIVNAGNITLDGTSASIVLSGGGTITFNAGNRLYIEDNATIPSGSLLTLNGSGTHDLWLNTDNITVTNLGEINCTGLGPQGGAPIGRLFTNGLNGILGIGTSGVGNKVTVDFTPTNNTVEYSATVYNTTHYNVIIVSNTPAFPASQIDIKGNFTINSAIDGTNADLNFNGTSTQTVGGTTNSTISDLTITNSNGISLNIDLTVSNSVTLSSGSVTCNTSNLIIDNGGTITGYNSSQWVKTNSTGGLTINQIDNTDGSVIFPVGRSSYNPCTLTNSGTIDDFTVYVYDDVTSDGTEGGTPYTGNVVDRTWMISEATPGGSNSTITLQWVGADELTLIPTSIHIAHYTGGLWDKTQPYIARSGGDPYTITQGGYTTFSPFGVGDNSGPLPVELVNFTAELVGNYVGLNWETATELKNDYFLLGRSVDGGDFVTIETIDGYGDSTSNIRYSTKDLNPPFGKIYYRLTQVDYDGEHNHVGISESIVLNENNPEKVIVKIITFLGQETTLDDKSPKIIIYSDGQCQKVK